MPRNMYYVEKYKGKDLHGPHHPNDITRLAEEGYLQPGDKIYDETNDRLIPAEKIKGLKFGKPFEEKASYPPLGTDTLKEKADKGLVLLDRHFDHMISPKLISWGYAIGFVLLAVLGALAIAHAVWDRGLKSALLYLVFWVFGLVGIRVGAELAILLFRANEYLKQISESIQRE